MPELQQQQIPRFFFEIILRFLEKEKTQPLINWIVINSQDNRD
jgi:hypothetical protein